MGRWNSLDYSSFILLESHNRGRIIVALYEAVCEEDIR